MKTTVNLLLYACLLIGLCSCRQNDLDVQDGIAQSSVDMSSESINSEAQISADEEPPAPFEATAEGHPVVTMVRDGEEKRYISLAQVGEVVLVPFATEEYSLPQVNYDFPSPQIINGLQIATPYATVYLDGKTLAIERGEDMDQWDMAALLLGEKQVYIPQKDQMNAFNERRFWFYQQDQYLTLFFLYSDLYGNVLVPRFVKVDLQANEVVTQIEIVDRALHGIIFYEGAFYVLAEPSQGLQIYYLYIISAEDLSIVHQTEGVDLPVYMDTAGLSMEDGSVWIAYVDQESNLPERYEALKLG